MILNTYNRIKNLWNTRGFELLLIITIAFIFFYWFFFTRNKKFGTYSLDYDYNPYMKKSKKYFSSSPKSSKGEVECRRVLQKIFGKPFPNQRPKYMFNSVTGHNLEIDCYNEQLKLGCEYHGRQHYEYVPFMHKTKDAFRNQQYRDQMKIQICNKLGIKLIIVPYKIKIQNIENYIKNKLNNFRF